ncbi:MAG: J domain-containing protein [Geminicoccaceae bacterium]
MTTLFLGALVVFGLIWGLRWFANAPVHDLAQLLRAFAAGFALLASTGLLFAGRLGFAIVTIGAAIYAIRAYNKGRRPPDPMEDDGRDHDDPNADIDTAYLAMTLDQRTGALDGLVKQGRHAGRRLADLDNAAVAALIAECRRNDPDSVALLEAYLERRRSDQGTAGTADDGASSSADGPIMDDAQAYRVLGLEPGADADAIKAAHKRLMAKLHPDRGGSDFLAAQINAARAHLLERRRRSR